MTRVTAFKLSFEFCQSRFNVTFGSIGRRCIFCFEEEASKLPGIFCLEEERPSKLPVFLVLYLENMQNSHRTLVFLFNPFTVGQC